MQLTPTPFRSCIPSTRIVFVVTRRDIKVTGMILVVFLYYGVKVACLTLFRKHQGRRQCFSVKNYNLTLLSHQLLPDKGMQPQW